MVASEKTRIEEQARSLGKDGLESRAKELKEAIAQNEVCTLLHARLLSRNRDLYLIPWNCH